MKQIFYKEIQMKKTVYFIQYEYYQYNSGQADNGYYKRKYEYESKKDALTSFKKFKDYLEKKLNDEDRRNLEDNYIPYAGYFTEVKLFKSVVEEILI